jgi:hypothetical protein
VTSSFQLSLRPKTGPIRAEPTGFRPGFRQLPGPSPKRTRTSARTHGHGGCSWKDGQVGPPHHPPYCAINITLRAYLKKQQRGRRKKEFGLKKASRATHRQHVAGHPSYYHQQQQQQQRQAGPRRESFLFPSRNRQRKTTSSSSHPRPHKRYSGGGTLHRPTNAKSRLLISKAEEEEERRQESLPSNHRCPLAPSWPLARFVVERSPAWGTVLVERNVDSLFMRERCCIGHKILRDSWLIKTKLGEVEEGNYTNRLSDQQGQAAINR